MTATGLPLQLLRLVSPSLPVGAFSYSRGLEWAVQTGWVKVTTGPWLPAGAAAVLTEVVTGALARPHLSSTRRVTL